MFRSRRTSLPVAVLALSLLAVLTTVASPALRARAMVGCSSNINSEGYPEDTHLESVLPLTAMDGLMTFSATLGGSAAWADGVQIQQDTTAGDVIFLQPDLAGDYLNSGDYAEYTMDFDPAIGSLSQVFAGLNNDDAVTVTAFYNGVAIPITAANFSNLSPAGSPGVATFDADGDGNDDSLIGTDTAGGTTVTTNVGTFTLDGPIDQVVIRSGKTDDASSTVTIGIHTIVACETGSIAGTVLEDTDGDGVGDTALGGVTVALLDGNGDPVLDLAGTAITAVTAADGTYEFTDVPAGAYQIAETDPSGLVSVSDTDGGDNNVTDVTVVEGEHSTGVDFVDEAEATVPPTPENGSIVGVVLEDTDGDGVGDSPMAGVTVALLDGNGDPVLDGAGSPITAVTGADGSYTFADVAPGDYQIAETDPSGFVSVSDTDGGDNNVTDVTVGDGEDVAGIDFTDEAEATVPPTPENGSITGSVLEDTDADGVGDSPLAGVTVALLDGNGDSVLDANGSPITAVTGADGSYTFADVAPGDYQVLEIDPTGFDSVGDTDGGDNNVTNVTVGDGEDVAGVDFIDEVEATVPPVVDLGSISGSVLEDTDGDGVGDSPLVGVTVALLDGNGDPVLDANGSPITTMTGADGSYSFSDVAAGSYQVLEVDPAGLDSVSDTDGGNLNVTDVTVGDNEDVTGIDFTDAEPTVPPVADLGSISGMVLEDTDGDGVGDSPISGVTVALLDGNGDAILDANGSPITAVTGTDGSYVFADVPAGSYQVLEIDPTGFDSVSDTDGGDNNVTNVTVGDNEDVAGIDFIDAEPTAPVAELGSISGVVLEDTDGDGVGDSPIAGVTVALLDGNGDPVLDANGNAITTVTAADGSYSFTDLATGSYQVLEVDPVGFTSVGDADGGDNNVSEVLIGDGEDVTGIDFVDEEPAAPVAELGSISGMVLEDTNGDGVGDSPIAGVTVALLDSNGDPVLDANDNPISTVTAADGSYTFTGVPAGSYQVLEVDPAGFDSVSDIDGGDSNVSNVVVAEGEDVTGVEFVDEQPAVITPATEPDVDENNVPGEPVTINPLANDSANLDPTTVQLIDPITGTPTRELVVAGEGVWTVDATTGAITFTPEAGFIGNPTVVEYQVQVLGTGEIQTNTVTVTYLVPPKAFDLSTSTPANTPATLAALLTATDLDGNVVSIVLIDPATGQPDADGVVTIVGQGTWRLLANGAVEFSPFVGFAGTSSLDYRAIDNDGLSSEPATLTVEVAQATSLPITGTPAILLLVLGLSGASAGAAFVSASRRPETDGLIG